MGKDRISTLALSTQHFLESMTIAATIKPDLAGLLPEEVQAVLADHFAARGQARYRAGQVARWLYERLAGSFDEMTDLPAAEREALKEAFDLTAPAVAKLSRSVDGTAKHLWRLKDGELIESVLIPTPSRLTLCISSQAGCAMACSARARSWRSTAAPAAGRTTTATARSATSSSWGWASR
jgi:hypothetical protein